MNVERQEKEEFRDGLIAEYTLTYSLSLSKRVLWMMETYNVCPPQHFPSNCAEAPDALRPRSMACMWLSLGDTDPNTDHNISTPKRGSLVSS